jgi:hypothetical protein
MSNYPPPGYYPPANPAYYPPERPRSGCGGCLKWFLIISGILFLLLIALCCGAGFYAQNYFKKSVTDKPDEVRKISEEIISMRVPDSLEPVGGGRFKVPLSGTFLGQGAVYADKDKTSMLLIGSFGDIFGPGFKDQLMQSLENGPGQKKPANQDDKSDRAEELKDVVKSSINAEIGGEKAVFEMTQGVGVKSNKKKIRVQGAFRGRTGPALLIIDAEEATLSREAAEGIIRSMK